MYEACCVSMWNAVQDSRKEEALSQLKCLSKIMSPGFSNVLFRNALDYIFYHAFSPEKENIRYIRSHFHSILPRTDSAEALISKNGFSKARRESKLRIEHITSIQTLGIYFNKEEFHSVLENFNVCIVTKSEYDVLGNGCGADRYKNCEIKGIKGIKLIIPLNNMNKTCLTCSFRHAV